MLDQEAQLCIMSQIIAKCIIRAYKEAEECQNQE